MDAEELQRSLRHATRLFDPVTPVLLADAARAHATRMPGADLAEVTFDSRTAPVPVRGGTHVRLLTFEAAALSVELEVAPSRSGNLLVGQLVPGGPAEVTVRGRHPMTRAADRLGRFAFPVLPCGPFSLLVRLRDGTSGALITDWVAL